METISNQHAETWGNWGLEFVVEQAPPDAGFFSFCHWRALGFAIVRVGRLAITATWPVREVETAS